MPITWTIIGSFKWVNSATKEVIIDLDVQLIRTTDRWNSLAGIHASTKCCSIVQH
jgi:hypothetical protein